MEEVYMKTRKAWRGWLKLHHDKSDGIWLVCYKKQTGKPSLEYDDAVEEALCFGWIDSIIKKIDDEKYVRKLTPRKDGSQWSELNKKRIAKLEKQGLMTEAGIAKVRKAKSSGVWDNLTRPEATFQISGEFKRALDKSGKAKNFFDQLAPSYKRQFIGWVAAAKRQETKAKRIGEAVALLERGEKLGMK
jgi:uncharacterized protein YdeI (YjbR/CyaY-like superfamily)